MSLFGKIAALAIVVAAVVATAVALRPQSGARKSVSQPKQTTQKTMNGIQTLVLAGGCFWCVEAIYEELKGVSKVESGYTGGTVPNPTYREVCSGTTGHAEAVRITFDPRVISADDLLRIFFTTHDPTTLNRQGADVGTQYRSAIFYANDKELSLAKKIIDEVTSEKIWNGKIVTTLEPLGQFYIAEDYHQDYYSKFEKADESEKGSMNAGYCRAIIEPKVRKFRAKYADKLKKNG